ncbi:MAG: hypothetical protein VX519_04390 [Myxococcota bacterium]|nr:hypothetical protein [Myxococcota bacterium]
MSMMLDGANSLLVGATSPQSPVKPSQAAQEKSAVDPGGDPAYTVSLSEAAVQGSRSQAPIDTLYNARGVTTDLSGSEVPQFQTSIESDVANIEMMLNGDYGTQLDDLFNK